jgi:hypothetical protein
MIKKWDKFVNETLSYDSIKNRIDGISKTPDSDYENGVNGKKSDLLHIFKNDLKMDSNNTNIHITDNHIVKFLYVYMDEVYNDISKEIGYFINKKLSANPDNNWYNIDRISSQISNKSINEIIDIILKVLDFYNKIKSQFIGFGIIETELKKEVYHITKMSIDENVLEFYDVIENYQNIYIELGYDKDDLNLEQLQKITDEISSVCGRITDATGLKNAFIEFGDNLFVGFEF